MTWKAWFTSLIQSFVGSIAEASGSRVTEKIAPKSPRDTGKSGKTRT